MTTKKPPTPRTHPLLLAVFLISLPAQAQYGGGSGTADDPYLIYTAEQMSAIGANRDVWNKHFKLMADIDMAACRDEYRIIGNYYERFSGSFDGSGRTIRNLTCTNERTALSVGLFGAISGGQIKDLILADPNVGDGSYSYVGALVGYCQECTVIRCAVRGGYVRGGSDVGGLVGFNGGNVRECTSSADVAGGSGTGGLVGYLHYGTIANCYSSGDVRGTTVVGGLVGYCSNQAAIGHCYSTGMVQGESRVGGLLGQTHGKDIWYCFWDVEASGQATSAAGAGKTSVEMKLARTYGGWGADGAWTILEGLDYPRLAWEGRPGGPFSTPVSPPPFIGSGTQEDPYLIHTADDLNMIGLFPHAWDKHYKLMADIDMRACPGTEFNVIGRSLWYPSYAGHPFTGVFDGNGHAISNFTYCSTDQSGVALFAVLSGFDAEIRNLRLLSPVIVAEKGSDVGALVGRVSNATVTDCHVRGGSITGERWVGGLVGDVGGVIDKCHVEECTIDGVERVGGLVALNRGLVANCHVTGTVTGDLCAGGLAGETMAATIVNCYTSVAVSGDTRVGGLVGYNRHTTIRDCYAVGPVTGSQLVGGLVGEDTTPSSVTGSFWNTQASGQATSGSGVGKTTAELQDPDTFVAAGWSFYGLSADPSAVWAMSPDTRYPMLWWQVDESQRPPLPAFPGGAGTPQDPYLIATAEQLNSIGHNPALMAAHFRLAGDIDLQGVKFFCIGDVASPYRGLFDGNDKTIANFTQVSEAREHIGLFGYVRGKDAQIRNLRLRDPNVSAQGGRYVAALVGYLDNGTVIGCHVEAGTILGQTFIGGLVGGQSYGVIADCSAATRVAGEALVGGLLGFDGWGSTMTNCHSTGAVTGDDDVGGLGGSLHGTVTGCHATGLVTGRDKVGGLAGDNSAKVMDCSAQGDVNGRCWIGGLVGRSYDPISRSYATGHVSGSVATGGLAGWNSDDINDCYATGSVKGVSQTGGLVGQHQSGTVQSSCATGTVSGSDEVGGLAGSNDSKGTIVNCYARGGVSGITGVGGLVGRNGWRIDASGLPPELPSSLFEYPGFITNSYSTGQVFGWAEAGGLIGVHACGSVTASFWDQETSGQTTSDGGQGQTTAQMQAASIYLAAGWDFLSETENGTEDTWWILEGRDYPRLWWEATGE